MKSIPKALTYDDVLLAPRFSSIKSRRDIDCTTRFTGQIGLSIPFVSADMDTVTQARMAIAMAELGGIGVIHRFLPIDAQVKEVTKVKRYQGEIIEEPYTISPQASVEDVWRLMEQLGVSGFRVVQEDNTLVGMLTHRDVQLASSDVTASERMTPRERLVVAPPDISLEEARQMLSARRLEKLPLVNGEGRLVGLITAKDLSKAQEPNRATCDSKSRLRVAAAVGVVGDFLERADALVEAEADALVIDIAHGDSALMLSAIHQLRERLGSVPLVAGNVATAEGTERLINAGADAVKVGVGPGSMCIARQVAGVGVPQFTAVLESSEVAHKHGVPVIADGGIRYPADVVKAVGAGASSVMLGKLLAGTDESPGIVITRDGRKMKVARGMASTEAAIDRAVRDDPTQRWAGSEITDTDVAAEGVQVPVPYHGSVKEVVRHLLSGLKSGMSYCDSATLDQLWQNAQFVQQTGAGVRESGPQGIDGL